MMIPMCMMPREMFPKSTQCSHLRPSIHHIGFLLLLSDCISIIAAYKIIVKKPLRWIEERRCEPPHREGIIKDHGQQVCGTTQQMQHFFSNKIL